MSHSGTTTSVSVPPTRGDLPGRFPAARRSCALLAFCLAASVAALVASPFQPGAQGEDPEPVEPAAAEEDRHPELRRLSPTEAVWIDRERGEVVVGGRVALDDGLLEFFACPAGTKEHESVVAVTASARLVHAALLAIGLEPGQPVSFDPEYRPAAGPKIRVTMRWTDADGAVQEADARGWIRNTRTGKALETNWVFAGSAFWKDPADGREYYQADGGDLVCVSNFPTATLDLPIESSQSNEALLFEVFKDRVPKRDTPVEMILSAAD